MRSPASYRPPGSPLNGYRRKRRLDVASAGLAESRHGRAALGSYVSAWPKPQMQVPLHDGGGRELDSAEETRFMPGTAGPPTQ
jgi:hypothetical protein